MNISMLPSQNSSHESCTSVHSPGSSYVRCGVGQGLTWDESTGKRGRDTNEDRNEGKSTKRTKLWHLGAHQPSPGKVLQTNSQGMDSQSSQPHFSPSVMQEAQESHSPVEPEMLSPGQTQRTSAAIHTPSTNFQVYPSIQTNSSHPPQVPPQIPHQILPQTHSQIQVQTRIQTFSQTPLQAYSRTHPHSYIQMQSQSSRILSQPPSPPPYQSPSSQTPPQQLPARPSPQSPYQLPAQQSSYQLPSQPDRRPPQLTSRTPSQPFQLPSQPPYHPPGHPPTHPSTHPRSHLPSHPPSSVPSPLPSPSEPPSPPLSCQPSNQLKYQSRSQVSFQQHHEHYSPYSQFHLKLPPRSQPQSQPRLQPPSQLRSSQPRSQPQLSSSQQLQSSSSQQLPSHPCPQSEIQLYHHFFPSQLQSTEQPQTRRQLHPQTQTQAQQRNENRQQEYSDSSMKLICSPPIKPETTTSTCTFKSRLVCKFPELTVGERLGTNFKYQNISHYVQFDPQSSTKVLFEVVLPSVQSLLSGSTRT
eukprot:TRINITY_DN8474_c0_g1_i8.p1 TRINITY_DN8474_c0_g1~~TRINITY_DN8474_c0_g1_i8.p1  ORF type:complete len:525 (+),score=57.62 TRINITY_DN8474_c0_g1_i8:62-1636(+)